MTKAERTRQHIIQKVASVFNRQGYAGTALSDIEVACGLTKGAIYGHFGNKDALAIACFDHNIAPLQKGLIRALSSTGNSHDKLKASIRFYREHFDEVASKGGCPLMNTSIEADDTLPFLKERVQQSISNWQEELVALIGRGKAEGCIETKVDAAQFATSMIGMIEGGILLAKAMDNALYFHQVINQLEELIEKDIRRK